MSALSVALQQSLLRHSHTEALLWLPSPTAAAATRLTGGQLLAAADFLRSRLALAAGQRLALAHQGPLAAAAVCAGLLHGWALLPLSAEEPRLPLMLAAARPHSLLCAAACAQRLSASTLHGLRMVEAEPLEAAMLRCVGWRRGWSFSWKLHGPPL